MSGETRLLRRLVPLLAALGPNWSSREQLLAAVGYVEDDEHAGRMLRRDLDALAALGFQVERSDGHHDPHWRLAGHMRFGRETIREVETPTKWCKDCRSWKRLDAFAKDARRSNGLTIYCKACLSGRNRSEGARESQKKYQAKDPDQKEKESARLKAYYQRKVQEGFRQIKGRWIKVEE